MTSSSLQLSSQLLVGELIKRASHQSPHGEAFVYNDQRKTFQEIDQTVSHLAGWLQVQGIKQDDKVAFMLKNSLAFVEIAMGIPMSGAIMKEYYNNKAATEAAFSGGWFHSGDLVKMDEEGFIYVVDRKKNMIISGGENIYPAEIEEVLYQMPEILECAVIGIADKKWGEQVKAIVVLKPGMDLNATQVIDYCQQKLASYKKPKEVEFIDELPRNTAGKVLKYALQQADQ